MSVLFMHHRDRNRGIPAHMWKLEEKPKRKCQARKSALSLSVRAVTYISSKGGCCVNVMFSEGQGVRGHWRQVVGAQLCDHGAQKPGLGL